MKNSFKTLKSLVWFTQLAFSVLGPLILCIWGSAWLRDRFGLGSWVVILGVLLGVGGAVSGFINALKTMKRAGGEDEGRGPVSFNDHE